MAILTEGVQLVKELTGLFKGPDPTPEQQRAKAGVWYSMLQDFVLNEPSSQELSNRWRDQLPFKQKSTKQRFMQNHIIGRNTDDIINTLVDKINDELMKGGFNIQNRETILTGMGANTMISTEPAGQQAVNTGVVGQKPGVDFGQIDDDNGPESQMFFVVIGGLILIAGVVTWIFYKPKRRRR